MLHVNEPVQNGRRLQQPLGMMLSEPNRSEVINIHISIALSSAFFCFFFFFYTRVNLAFHGVLISTGNRLCGKNDRRGHSTNKLFTLCSIYGSLCILWKATSGPYTTCKCALFISVREYKKFSRVCVIHSCEWVSGPTTRNKRLRASGAQASIKNKKNERNPDILRSELSKKRSPIKAV